MDYVSVNVNGVCVYVKLISAKGNWLLEGSSKKVDFNGFSVLESFKVDSGGDDKVD